MGTPNPKFALLHRGLLSLPEELINEARNGRMFMLVDDDGRASGGGLVIPAQMATPDAINFMATHGRSPVCLALTKQRIEQLGFNVMSRKDGSRDETEFTVPIKVRDGVTTGISAADLARTIACAINAAKTAPEIGTLGHVVPLVAREGGVLVRPGSTEAAVDVARLAGLNPSGVICEVINKDGTMARLDDLAVFAQRHNLKIGTIRDLVAYRLRHDRLVERRAEARFTSRWGGEWTTVTFYNKADGTEQVALIKGEPSRDKPTLVRMHVLSPFADLFGGDGESGDPLSRSMEIIAAEGAGVIVLLVSQRNDALTRAVQAKAGALNLADMDDQRDVGVGAQILAELGIDRPISEAGRFGV